MPLKILMFSDFICPFCYIGFEVVRKLKPEFDIELEWRGFEIHPEWPLEGMPAERFYQSFGPERRRAVWQTIHALADEIQLPMKAPAIMSNSRLALEAAEFAAESNLGEVFEERVYRAYFTEDANIGDPAVLQALAREVGLDPVAMEEALLSGRYALKLKSATLAAHERDVTGVPTFFIGEFPLVGAQSLDVMRRVLKRAVERRV
jgi:predicted DsbA family dithiol-disulfide isomerase